MKKQHTSKIRLSRGPSRASLGMILVMLAAPLATPAAQLQPETIRAFEHHVAAESWQTKALAENASYLSTAASVEQRRLLQNGETIVNPVRGKGDIAVEKGLVHHWIGGVFVAGRTADDALALLRDFDAYKQVYTGSVEDSKTLGRDGEVYQTFLRLRKHRVVTVVLNTEYDVEFSRVDEKRWHSRSASTRIAQVKDADSPEERELPVGDDSGFLWRIVTFWRVEEADGGVYLECEVIGLTRGVPYGLGWLIRPIIRSFPRESLSETLSDTQHALLEKNRNPLRARPTSRVSLVTGAEPPSELSLVRP